MSKKEPSRVDVKELELPDTVFSRDIDNKVLQGIIVKSLSKISGIGMVEGNLFDSILGRVDRVKGIYTEQDPKTLAVKIRVEVSIQYGVSIPQKAEEIQIAVAEDITKATGLRVSEVHVVFKELMQDRSREKAKTAPTEQKAETLPEDYSEDF